MSLTRHALLLRRERAHERRGFDEDTCIQDATYRRLYLRFMDEAKVIWAAPRNRKAAVREPRQQKTADPVTS
jgi:hypothetical protein